MKRRTRVVVMSVLFVVSILTANSAVAGVPVINIEGEGGGGLIAWAYLTNPPADGEILGKPSVAATYIFPTNFQLSLYHFNVSVTYRLELGITRTTFDTSSLLGAASLISGGNSADLGINEIVMDTYHAKVLLLKESEALPAVALSVEFKDNKDIARADEMTGYHFSDFKDTDPTTGAGLDDDSGVDVILSVTKLFKETFLGMPILANVSGRFTKANQTGYLGFSDDSTIQPEITLAVLPESNVAVGFEYRGKPDEYQPVTPGHVLTFEEDDWADFFVAYFPTPGLSVSAAIVNFGHIVDRKVNSGLWMNMKYDF